MDDLSDKLEAAEKLADAERAGAKALQRESKLAKEWEEIARLEREVTQANAEARPTPSPLIQSGCLLPIMTDRLDRKTHT